MRRRAEAIVLLKNNGTLPLKKVKSIAVIQGLCPTAQILGGGSSSVTPHYAVSPYEGSRTRAGDKIRVELRLDASSTKIYGHLKDIVYRGTPRTQP